ncbi:MAG: hypothetical protein Q7R35_10690 [Elusimicrobiota bacterium]|nr:hypothetical protein [Elusimicrobiota bacterium]
MDRNSFNVYLVVAAAPAVLAAAYYLIRWYVPLGSYYDRVLKRRKKLLWSIAVVIVLNCISLITDSRAADDVAAFIDVLAVFIFMCWNSWRLAKALGKPAGPPQNGVPGVPDPPPRRCGLVIKVTFKCSAILASAGIAFLAALPLTIMIHDRVSSGYTSRRNPDLVETRTIEGFTVRLVRWTSPNPLLGGLDWMFLRLRIRAFIETHEKAVDFIEIDLSEDEEKVSGINKGAAEIFAKTP